MAKPRDDLEKAAEIADVLTRGGVALVPTDTVYGLVARPDHPHAVARIFALKRRPKHVNLQVLMPENTRAETIGARVPAPAAALLADPALRATVTCVLSLDPTARPDWFGERDEAGFRLPGDARIQAVLARTGPLYATSANAHGSAPGQACPEILVQLDGAPDAIWDVGRLGGEPSTVVNFNADPATVLRWGAARDLRRFGLGHA